MTRLLFECTNVFRNPGVNSGIQRVVRNIIRQLDNTSSEAECVPVIIVQNKLLRVTQLIPEDKALKSFPARLFSLFERINHAFWNRHALMEERWQLSRRKNPRRILFVLAKLAALPLALSLRLLRALGHDQMHQRTQPFEPQSGDQLVLLDSSWHSQHFSQIEALRKNGLGIVAVMYDLLPVTHPHLFEKRLKDTYNTWFDWIIHQADGFMAISMSVRDEMCAAVRDRIGAQAADTRFFGHFHLGSELDLRQPEAAISPSLAQVFDSDETVFLAVGTIEPRKNHQYLLDAFNLAWASGSKARLCIIGRIGWKCEDLLERIRTHKAYGSRLFLLNDVDDSGLEFAYQNASALVFSSLAEGFGLPIVEAMQRGLPVMGSDIPVFREVGGLYMAYFDLTAPASLATLVQGFEQTGQLPVEQSLADWHWVDWKGSAQQLIDGILRSPGQTSRQPQS